MSPKEVHTLQTEGKLYEPGLYREQFNKAVAAKVQQIRKLWEKRKQAHKVNKSDVGNEENKDEKQSGGQQNASLRREGSIVKRG